MTMDWRRDMDWRMTMGWHRDMDWRHDDETSQVHGDVLRSATTVQRL